MDLEKIINFEGKRNCSLTLFIPSNQISKTINFVEKSITTIKHENKKRQLLNILSVIKSNIKNINKNKHDNIIICCGLDTTDKIEYYNLTPNKKINELEYYYDYKFHINKIYDFMYDNIEYIYKKDLLETLQESDLIVYEKDLEKFIELRLISDIFYFSSDILDYNFVKKSIEYSYQIKIFSLDSNLLNDVQKRYGKIIGILYFKIEI